MLSRDRALKEERKRNEKLDPPSENQLQWDIRHIREDMMLLCNQHHHTNILLLILLLLVIILIVKV